MPDANDDEAFRLAIAVWDRRLAEAGDALDREAPSADVWDSISARLDQLEAARDTLTVPAASGHWETVSPGVLRKRLHIDAAAGWQTMLMRVEAGATVPSHDHATLEECFVLEGEFELGGETVCKGDLHLGFPGREHADIVSHTGALLYIRTAA